MSYIKHFHFQKWMCHKYKSIYQSLRIFQNLNSILIYFHFSNTVLKIFQFQLVFVFMGKFEARVSDGRNWVD